MIIYIISGTRHQAPLNLLVGNLVRVTKVGYPVYKIKKTNERMKKICYCFWFSVQLLCLLFIEQGKYHQYKYIN